ncbi:hypothetical protein Tco_0757061 [Tanacetum coccineum]
MGYLCRIRIQNFEVDLRYGHIELPLFAIEEDSANFLYRCTERLVEYSLKGVCLVEQNYQWEKKTSEGNTFVVLHAVAIASAQKNKGSLEAESIVRAASTRVRFRLSTTPFRSGVRGVDV